MTRRNASSIPTRVRQGRVFVGPDFARGRHFARRGSRPSARELSGWQLSDFAAGSSLFRIVAQLLDSSSHMAWAAEW